MRDILETGESWREKSYCLDANYYKATNGTEPFTGRQSSNRMMVAEPVCVAQRGRYGDTGNRSKKTDAEISQYYEAREDGKTNTLTTVLKDNQIAEPVKVLNINPSGKGMNGTVMQVNGKSNCLTTNKGERQKIIEPVRIGTIESGAADTAQDSQQYRVYSPDAKAVTQCGNGGGQGAKTGLYATPIEPAKLDRLGGLYNQDTRWGIWNTDGLSPTLTASMGMGGGHIPMISEETQDTNISHANPTEKRQIYEVRNGLITIKDKQYPIKLADGYYIIRKLTVTECCRLQGMPDWWFDDEYGNKIISNSQCYKGLGNGWQLDTVKYLMSHMPIDKSEQILCISMYDGICTGRRILEELGYTNVKYIAYEIDKYCVKLSSFRYPDIVHMGDAFQVREEGWIDKIYDYAR